MSDHELALYGPLASLIGTWEGSRGTDIAPSDDRRTETNLYRERVVFEPMGRVDNHEQVLYSLRYSMVAWRIGEPNPFHEENGYWLWDAQAGQVMKCFQIPRGVAILAGGTSKADAREFTMSAKVGSDVYGISSNLFLDREFKTTHYQITVKMLSSVEMQYTQTTTLMMSTQSEPFLHTDSNRMTKVTSI